MDFEYIFSFLAGHSQIGFYILSFLGALVVVGSTYVQLTPSLKDDEKLTKIENMPVLGQILKILERFSPIQRKKKD